MGEGQRILLVTQNERLGETIKEFVNNYGAISRIPFDYDVFSTRDFNPQHFRRVLHNKSGEYNVCFIPDGFDIESIEDIHSRNPSARIVMVGSQGAYAQDYALRLSQCRVFRRALKTDDLNKDVPEIMEDLKQEGAFRKRLKIALLGYGGLNKSLVSRMVKDSEHFSEIHLFGSTAREVIGNSSEENHSYGALVDAKGMSSSEQSRFFYYPSISEFAESAANADELIVGTGRWIPDPKGLKRGPGARSFLIGQLEEAVRKFDELNDEWNRRGLEMKAKINPLSNPNGALSYVVWKRTGLDHTQISSVTADLHRAKRSVAIQLESKRFRGGMISLEDWRFPEDTAIQKALDGFLGEDKITEQNIDYVEVVGEHHDPRISIENARIVVKDQSIKMSDLVKARKDRAIIEEGARRSLIRLALETARGAKLLGVEATDVPDIITSYYQRVSEFRDTRDFSKYVYDDRLGAFIMQNGNGARDIKKIRRAKSQIAREQKDMANKHLKNRNPIEKDVLV